MQNWCRRHELNNHSRLSRAIRQLIFEYADGHRVLDVYKVMSKQKSPPPFLMSSAFKEFLRSCRSPREPHMKRALNAHLAKVLRQPLLAELLLAYEVHPSSS